jgi:hypothetical protein
MSSPPSGRRNPSCSEPLLEPGSRRDHPAKSPMVVPIAGNRPAAPTGQAKVQDRVKVSASVSGAKTSRFLHIAAIASQGKQQD